MVVSPQSRSTNNHLDIQRIGSWAARGIDQITVDDAEQEASCWTLRDFQRIQQGRPYGEAVSNVAARFLAAEHSNRRRLTWYSAYRTFNEVSDPLTPTFSKRSARLTAAAWLLVDFIPRGPVASSLEPDYS